MRELGNLAIICAQRPDVLMQLRGGKVFVRVGTDLILRTGWDNDGEIRRSIHELNFGKYSGKGAR